MEKIIFSESKTNSLIEKLGISIKRRNEIVNKVINKSLEELQKEILNKKEGGISAMFKNIEQISNNINEFSYLMFIFGSGDIGRITLLKKNFLMNGGTEEDWEKEANYKSN